MVKAVYVKVGEYLIGKVADEKSTIGYALKQIFSVG
jgi:hypothetical protein